MYDAFFCYYDNSQAQGEENGDDEKAKEKLLQEDEEEEGENPFMPNDRPSLKKQDFEDFIENRE